MSRVPLGLGFALLRVFAGGAMAFHGWGKVPIDAGFLDMVQGMGVPWPVMAARFAVISEIAGGLLMAVGWYARGAALAILSTLAMAIVVYHAGHAFEHRELALMHFGVAFAVLVDGPGRWSVDARRRHGDGVTRQGP